MSQSVSILQGVEGGLHRPDYLSKGGEHIHFSRAHELSREAAAR